MRNRTRATRSAAEAIRPLIDAIAPDLRTRLELWDDTFAGAIDGPAVRIRSSDALRRLVWAPGELGFGRAYVAGDIDIDGDIFETMAALKPAGANLRMGPRQLAAVLVSAGRVGAIGRPLPPPPEEVLPKGRRHSLRRDARAISHHYDVSSDFFQVLLGPSITYSCARFAHPGMTLEDAQASKHDLICRKLGLHERPGMRLLDVGCGWGSMAIHAATHYGTNVVGVTISREQRDTARQRVTEAGVEHLIEIRLQDYREVRDMAFDAISSIGMSEHVGARHIDEYFTDLAALLQPKGRLLNHAITSKGGSRLGRRSFMARYVFPDGEILDLAETIAAMQRAGLEIRDVESLREHYALTLRQWVANLEEGWEEAVRLVGEGRARIWRLYMAASALGFEDGGVAVHQVLGVAPTEGGESGMPLTRTDWATPVTNPGHQSRQAVATAVPVA